MRSLARRLPGPATRSLMSLRSAVRPLGYYVRSRFCPVCEVPTGEFAAAGVVPRDDALCRSCGALERHRLAWLFLKERTDLFDGRPKRMLHVAPEPCFESRLRRHLGAGYLTADLEGSGAMVRMDITDIQYPDETFDVIFCSHVLEHVPDDRKAMRECARVLKRDGWALMLVPITADRTFEDPSVTDPDERLRLFGQEDHVRRYGPDYVDRLRDSGFRVETTGTGDLVTPRQATRMGLTPASGEIHFCTKGE